MKGYANALRIRAQSASADADSPRKLVMDKFEQRMGQVPMLLACVGYMHWGESHLAHHVKARGNKGLVLQEAVGRVHRAGQGPARASCTGARAI